MKTTYALLYLMAERAMEGLKVSTSPDTFIRDWGGAGADLSAEIVLQYAEEAVSLTCPRSDPNFSYWVGRVLGNWYSIPSIRDLAITALTLPAY